MMTVSCEISKDARQQLRDLANAAARGFQLNTFTYIAACYILNINTHMNRCTRISRRDSACSLAALRASQQRAILILRKKRIITIIT